MAYAVCVCRNKNVCFFTLQLPRSLGSKGENLLGYPDLLVGPKLREHWQRHDFTRNSSRHWKVIWSVVHRKVGLLHMQGNWIVNSRADTRLVLVLHHCVAIVGSDHIEVIHSARPRRLVGKAIASLLSRRRLYSAARSRRCVFHFARCASFACRIPAWIASSRPL